MALDTLMASMRRRHGTTASRTLGLIDLGCYITHRPNSTTASTKTSTGLPITVSMCAAAAPPSLSQICVHCPGLGLDEKKQPPRVICSDDGGGGGGDLVVLIRVPLDPVGRVSQISCDYFVYSAAAHPRPTLDLIPNPYPARLGDDDIGILSRGGDGGYVVASLRVVPIKKYTFDLHLYRSVAGGGNGGGGRWTKQRVCVEEPVRDMVCPVPDDADINVYHITNQVIILGGDEGLIGWVDLWRGILICDVLSETPNVRDVPLPAPAKGNWTKFRNYCPRFCRSIAVDQRRSMIKYVEMEISLPRKLPVITSSRRSEPTSFYEWVHSRDDDDDQEPGPISFYEWVYSHHRDDDDDQECPKSYRFVPSRWTATMYSMSIPVASWDGGWRRDCSLRLAGIKLPDGNPRQSKLLCRLMSTAREQQEASTKATLSLEFVSMAYPALTAGDDDDGGDVIYLLSKGRTGMEAVIAVDVRERAVRGVAKLDTQRHVRFQRCFMATAGISKHTKISSN